MRTPAFASWSNVARAASLIGLASSLLLSVTAAAQSSGKGFLFKRPVGSFALRGGFSQPRGSSDIFSFITDELTLGRGDFAGASLGADLAFRIKPRVDLVFGTSYDGSTAHSEFRRFVDNNDLPIEQTTSLARVPFTVSAKLYLTSPGRSIGRYAWVPATFAPFVGLGGGFTWYRFRQQGDFIDRGTLDVFSDRFRSSGWAPTANLFAGLDVALGPRFGVTGEGRYLWARGPMSTDFSNFDRIDLSGYNASLGVYVRF
jgi:hypothetical protein